MWLVFVKIGAVDILVFLQICGGTWGWVWKWDSHKRSTWLTYTNFNQQQNWLVTLKSICTRISLINSKSAEQKHSLFHYNVRKDTQWHFHFHSWLQFWLVLDRSRCLLLVQNRWSRTELLKANDPLRALGFCQTSVLSEKSGLQDETSGVLEK